MLKNILILSAIFILGFFLRVYHLSSNPAGFFCDEASIGYNAYSILLTGKDEYGTPFPVFFRSFGDYKDPIEIYSTVPFVAILGLNEVAARLPAVLYGMGTIVILFFLGKEIKSTAFGFLSAFLLSTMPWFVHYNRIGFELTSYAAFFCLSILLWFKAVHNRTYIIPAFVISSLAFYTYQPSKLLVPALLVGFCLIYGKNYIKYKKELIAGVVLAFLVSIPLLLSFFNGVATARFNMVSVFSANLPFPKIIITAISNYLIQLSPWYFVSGEPTFITRHFINGLTPLLLVTIPFLYLGIIHIFITIKQKTSQFLVYWLLLYPLAGAVVASAPFTSRSIIGAPLCAILISFGFFDAFNFGKQFIRKEILFIALSVGLVINLLFFIQFYFVQYPLQSADFWGWQYGARDIVQYFSSHEKSYDSLIMSPAFNAPDIFLRFYAPFDCRKCSIGTPDSSYIKGQKQLFAVSPEYMLSHLEFMYVPVKTILYPNGNTAFVLTLVVPRKTY